MKQSGFNVDNIKLIQLVRMHKNLWDKRFKEYLSRDLSKNSWTEISEELKVPADICKTKWYNLRDTFRKEYNKFVDLNLTPKWRFYEEMLFLLEQLGPLRETLITKAKNKIMKDKIKYGNINFEAVQDPLLDDSNSQHIERIEYEDIDDENLDSERQYSFTIVSDDYKSVRYIPQTETTSQNHNNTENEHKNIKVKPKYLNLQKRTFSEEQDNENDKMIKSITNDPDSMFLLSLAPYLKKFSEEKRLLVRHKIQGVILNEMKLSND